MQTFILYASLWLGNFKLSVSMPICLLVESNASLPQIVTQIYARSRILYVAYVIIGEINVDEKEEDV